MDTQFSDDLNTIRADDLADAQDAPYVDDRDCDYQYEKALDYTEQPEGFENLEGPEDVAEFEAWLDGDVPKGWENAPLSAQVARMMYPDDGEEFDRMKAYLKGE